MGGKPFMKGAWSHHVNHLFFFGRAPTTSLERLIVSGAVNFGGRLVWQTGDGLG